MYKLIEYSTICVREKRIFIQILYICIEYFWKVIYELAPVAVTREGNGLGVVGDGMRLSFHYILLSHEFISGPSIKHPFIPFIHSFT